MTTTKVWYVSIAVDPSIKYSEKNFSKKVQKVLQDPRGWENVLNINFKFVKPNEKLKHPRKIHVRLSENDLIYEKCNINNMSCCDMSTGEVWINIDRWVHGSNASKLDIYGYRTYLINHEVGHALGFLHQQCECSDELAICDAYVPVMTQQTLDIGKCKPNPYPLVEHIKNASRKNYRK